MDKVLKINYCPMLTLAERAQLIKDGIIRVSQLSEGEQVKIAENWFDRKKTLKEEDCLPSILARNLSIDTFAKSVSGEIAVEEFPLTSEFAPEQIFSACEKASRLKPEGFSDLIRPFTYIFTQSLSKRLKNEGRSLGYGVFDDAVSYLSMKLLSISLKTFIQDLHEVKAEVGLIGDTPQERLKQYINQVGAPSNLIKLYMRYPVLYRRMTATTASFLDFVEEILQRYFDNLDEIAETFFPDRSGAPLLTGMHFGQGDTHQHGKAVVVLETDCGKLVYKPRDLTVETVFRKVESFFHPAPNYLKQRHPKHLHGNGYAFVEYISHTSCESSESVKAYYRRYGELIALMFLCNGTDMHYENIVAYGEYPVIIDIETLFSTPINIDAPQWGIVGELSDKLKDSVASSLLLPRKTALKLGADPVDLSGLAEEQIVIQDAGYVPIDLDTDEARFVKTDTTVTVANNKVMLGKTAETYRDHVVEIIAGFCTVTSFFLENKTEFIRLIESLPGFSIRVLARDTHRYARLLDFSFHPACMKDYADCEKVLENLFSYPFKDKRVVALEYNDLLAGDIPLLSADFCGDAVVGAEQCVEHALVMTPKQYLIKKLRGVDKLAMEDQVSIIQMTCQGFAGKEAHQITFEGNDRTESSLLDAISEQVIGSRRITEDGLEATWHYVLEDASGSCSPSIMPVDFYDGLSGIIFYLSLMDRWRGTRQFDAVIDQIKEAIQHSATSTDDGGYTGLTSLVRLMISGVVADKGLDDIESLAARKIEGDCRDIGSQASTEVDYLNGALGRVKLYCDLAMYSKDSWYLEVAEATLAKHIAEIEDCGELLSCCGIGHGISGLLVSLGSLYRQTSDRSYLSKIEKYNKMLANNILDCKRMSWCRGSIGGLLSQLYLLSEDIIPRLPDWFIDVEKRLDSWEYSSDDICHGSCGRIQYHLDRYALEGNPRHVERARQFVCNLEEAVFENSAIGVYGFKQFSNVGLFTGLSGIGYTILRAANPNLPSVLI